MKPSDSGMGKKSNLGILDFSQIFQGVASAKRTGTLSVSSNEDETHIYFDEGRIVDLCTSSQKHSLGKALLKSGQISEKTLHKALALQEYRVDKLGKILLEGKLADEKAIRTALEFQYTEEICELFTWKDISCDFIEGEPLDVFGEREIDFHISLNAESLVMEAARRIDEWELVRKTVSSLKDVYVVSPKGAKLLETGAEQEKNVIALLDGLNDLEEVTEKALMSHFETLKHIHHLALSGEVTTIAPAEYYKKGIQCAANGNLRKCVKLFERAEELGVREFDLPNRLAKVYEMLGETGPAFKNYVFYAMRCEERGRGDDAVLAYQNALKHDPRNEEARRALIDVLVRQHRFEEVTRQTEMLVAVLLESGNPEGAVAAWQRAIKAQPDNLEPYRRLTDLYQTIGDTTQAIIELENLAASYLRQKRPERAVEIYREMLLLDPGCVEARLGLSETLSTIGQRDAAFEEYRMLASSLSKSGINITSANQAFIVNVYEKMAALKPDDTDTRDILAAAYFETNEPQKAISHLKDVARIKVETGKPREAVVYFRRVIENDSDDIRVRLDLAEAMLLAQDKDGAISTLHGLVEHLVARARYAEARRTYEKILEISPFDMNSLNGLAGLCRGDSDREDKFQIFRRICTLARGACLYREGLDAAVEAESLRNGDLETLEDLVFFTQRLGDSKRVVKYLEKLLQKHLEENNLGVATSVTSRILALDGTHVVAKKTLEEIGRRKARLEGASVAPSIIPPKRVIAAAPRQNAPPAAAPPKEGVPGAQMGGDAFAGVVQMAGPILHPGAPNEGERVKKPTSVLQSLSKLKAMKSGAPGLEEDVRANGGNASADPLIVQADARTTDSPQKFTAPASTPPAPAVQISGSDELPTKIDGTKVVKGTALGGAASKLAALRKKKGE
jgi:tetratricopeptide (TPR) repeat protein